MIYIKLFKNRYIGTGGLVIFGLAVLVFSSCRVSRESAYFKTLQKDTTISGFVTNDFESRIQVGDQLSIMASSKSALEDEQFNKAAAESSSPAMSGFTVNKDGTVLLHRLGNVTAAGLTRKELAAFLQKALLPYMAEPIVHVNYLNHKVTVMGEVGSQQVLQMPEEQLSLIDVLVKSGGIGFTGQKDRVMIIREEGSEKKVKFVNLEDNSLFNSPWYYVQPNDVIVVRADYAKMQKAERRQNLQTNIAFITTGISLLFLVVDRIIR
jgi:polysaccharide biosynthesis/export protein